MESAFCKFAIGIICTDLFGILKTTVLVSLKTRGEQVTILTLVLMVLEALVVFTELIYVCGGVF